MHACPDSSATPDPLLRLMHAVATSSVLLQLSWFSRLPDFCVNPLEPIDRLTKLSRVYDDWVGRWWLGSTHTL